MNQQIDVFTAVADPTRRHILEMLAAKGQLSASDIYGKFTTTPPAISQHLKILKETELVTVEKQAQKRLYRINAKKIQYLKQWANTLTHQWNARFDTLEKLLEKEKHTDFAKQSKGGDRAWKNQKKK